MLVIDELPARLRGDAIALWHAVGLTRPWNDPAADLDRALTGSTSAVLAACDAGALVGTVMVGYDGHRGWMYYLAVAEAHQGKGLGRDLVRAAEAWLTDRGAPKVLLMVRRTNAGVVGFYEALGYVDQDTVVLGRFL